jgi:O-antigen/teichoic acid export membrane protein
MNTTIRTDEPDVLTGPDLAGRVVRGGAARAGGFAVVNLLGIAGSVVLLHYLGVADFGRYGTVTALVAIVTGVADAGLTVTGSRELSLLPRGPDRRDLLGAIVGARLLLSTLAMLAAVAFAAVAGYDDVMVVGTALAGAGGILIGAQAALTLPLNVELRNGLLAVSEIVKQVILLVGIVALVGVGASLGPFFAVQIAVGAGALIAVPFLVQRSHLTRPTLSRAGWQRLAVTALPVALASVVTVLYVRLLVVLSSLLTSEFQTGLFVTSARITEMVGGLAILLSGVILPVATVAARDDRDRLRYVLVRTTKVALLVGGLLALVVVVAARPIVVLLGGEEFAPAASVLRLQAPVVLTIFLVYPWTAFMIADGRRRDLVRCMLAGLALVVVAGLVLISQLDARGAALAALVADVGLAAMVVQSVRRVGDHTWPVPGSFLWRYVLVLGLACGAGVATLQAAPAVVAAVVAAAVFGAGAVALRIVPEELTELIPRRG